MDGAQTRLLSSRLAGRSLAAELWRQADPSPLLSAKFARTISAGLWFRWYFGTLIVGVALAFAMDMLFHLHAIRGLCLYCGLLFFAGAADRPRVAFLMMREVRWFGLIKSDQTVRAFMWVLGFAMLVAAALLRSTAPGSVSGRQSAPIPHLLTNSEPVERFAEARFARNLLDSPAGQLRRQPATEISEA